MRRKGVFITLEGNEGCGKSTQIKLLYARLEKERKKVFLTREPGGTAAGDAIRGILLDDKMEGLSGVTETLLYMASRAQLVKEVIAPKLASGHVVLCDRWLDATVAYQGYGEGVDASWIAELGKKVTAGVAPKLTIFLDLPLETGLDRAVSHKKADRMEQKPLSFHKKVREGYRAIAKREPARFKRLAVRPEDPQAVVHERVMELVRRVL